MVTGKQMENEAEQSLVELEETLDLVLSDDDEEDDDAQQSTGQDIQGDDGLSFKEISEEWKMVAWFTESICVRSDKTLET